MISPVLSEKMIPTLNLDKLVMKFDVHWRGHAPLLALRISIPILGQWAKSHWRSRQLSGRRLRSEFDIFSRSGLYRVDQSKHTLTPRYGLPVRKLRGNGPPVKWGVYQGFSKESRLQLTSSYSGWRTEIILVRAAFLAGGDQALPVVANLDRSGDAADVGGQAMSDRFRHSCLSALSLTATRPPGLRTRAISRKTAGLSGARLRTQFEMTQSTEESGVESSRSWTARSWPRSCDANGTTLRTSHLCREKHVKAATGAEINDHLARLEMSGCRGVTAGKAHIGLGWN